jgi:hypothetical protein
VQGPDIQRSSGQINAGGGRAFNTEQ